MVHRTPEAPAENTVEAVNTSPELEPTRRVIFMREFMDAVRECFLHPDDEVPANGEFVPPEEASKSFVTRGGEITGKSMDAFPPIEVDGIDFLHFVHRIKQITGIDLSIQDLRDGMLAGATEPEIALAHHAGYIDNQYLVSLGKASSQELRSSQPVSNDELIRRTKAQLEKSVSLYGGTLPWTVPRLYKVFENKIR